MWFASRIYSILIVAHCLWISHFTFKLIFSSNFQVVTCHFWPVWSVYIALLEYHMLSSTFKAFYIHYVHSGSEPHLIRTYLHTYSFFILVNHFLYDHIKIIFNTCDFKIQFSIPVCLITRCILQRQLITRPTYSISDYGHWHFI